MPARGRGHIVRAGYDAAKTTAENRRHWAAADSLSPASANSAGTRRTLRNRARYEVANNSYAKGIVLTLADYAIGTGPRLQLLTPNETVNRQVEFYFGAWAKAVGLADKLRTLHMARVVDGEAFGVLTSNPAIVGPVQLDLRPLEADYFTTPDAPTTQLVDGIVFDEHGNPVEYHCLRDHPGDLPASGSLLDYDRLPASSVLHWFRADRSGQARGIPELTPALPLFAQLRRFTLAVLAAAETAADYAAVIYTDAPPNGESEDYSEIPPEIEIERRTLTPLPAGWKIGQLTPEQPATTYAEFKREILAEIARCLRIPYNVAAGDSSGSNYASGRLDWQAFHKALRVDRSKGELVVLDRIFAAWLDEAALVPGLIPEGAGAIADWPHQWFWDGLEHVDPLKEANAQAVRLASHTTNLAEEYARQGRDWEESIRQRAREVQLLRDLGLEVETPQQQVEDVGNEE